MENAYESLHNAIKSRPALGTPESPMPKQTDNLPNLSFRGSEATVGISWRNVSYLTTGDRSTSSSATVSFLRTGRLPRLRLAMTVVVGCVKTGPCRFWQGPGYYMDLSTWGISRKDSTRASQVSGVPKPKAQKMKGMPALRQASRSPWVSPMYTALSRP